MRIEILIAASLFAFGIVAELRAQTCAAPVEFVLPPFSPAIHSGNSCDSTNTLPYLANGAISISGEEVVYHLARASNAYAGSLTLTADANVDLSLFVCRGPCGTYATCIAAIDNGAGAANTAQIPAGAGDYFVIVGSIGESATTCGNYTLTSTFPLND